ncbi:MAG: hypothetical protein JXR34_09585 [Bacteroidales bacterium]|nr:hypothetical protein [Bacteroidales bacterium]
MINKNIVRSLFLLGIVVAFVFSSCKKKEDDFDESASLSFSIDTITFDTVFTTIGSSTEYFMIYNTSNKPVLISKIYLANGSASNFRMNVDGLTGYQLHDVEIGPNDSLWAFVEVTVDPNGGNTPLLITDSIVFETNGKIQDVDLVAYGQDAYFIIANRHVQGLPPYRIIAGEGIDTTWTSDKPIVIYGYAVVDSAAILRIDAGTKIYFHNNSGLWVYIGGTLEVNGGLGQEVVFQGDRLESSYSDVAGQWDRIWLNETPLSHKINYAIIRNGFIGVQTEPLANYGWNAKVDLNNTIIENMSGAGVLCRAAQVVSENLLVSNCQQYGLALTVGGNYQFTHATIGNFWSGSVRTSPAVYFNNYLKDGNNTVYPNPLIQADFVNCIIYGNIDNEFLPDSVSGTAFNFKADHCLIRTDVNTSSSRFIGVLKNVNPLFNNYYDGDYQLQSGSPALNSGKPTTISTDIKGELRDVVSPSLGAFELPAP